jgi:hypothetical protein
LIAESGGVIATPKTLLKERLSVGYDFSKHDYTIKKPEYEELQNSLIFYKSYATNNSNLTEEEVIAWAAAFCLFVVETYKNNTSGKTNWAWEDFESLIDCDFDDEIRENLLRLGLEKFWGGAVNSQNLLLSLGITEVAITNVINNATNTNNVTALDLYENDLKQKISRNTYPFLGLYGIELTDDIRTAIKNESGTVNNYIGRLNKRPALFSVYLAKSIADGTGQTNGALEIYPVIAKAIGLTDLNVTITDRDREPLWRAFRKACQSLEMKVSPRTSGNLYMSDEYLLQAGIPEAFLPDVTTKMFNLANRIGLPSDDPQQFQQWQNTFNNSLGSSFPQTAKRSLLLDEDGFYIKKFKKFIELYQAGNATDPSQTESIMLNAITIAKDGGTGILPIAKPKLEVPQFIFRNDQIGVLLPSSETNQTWAITTTDQYNSESNFQYQVDLDEKFIPFDWSPLILKVEVKNVVSELSLDFNVWEENDSTDRFLLFSESGEIHTSSKNDIEKLQLEIGSYVLFSRFQPNVNWVDISQKPNVFKSEIDLAAGKQIQISGNFTIETLDIATMSLTGVSVRSNEGTEIYASENLILTVNVPNDNQISHIERVSSIRNSIYVSHRFTKKP